MQPLVFTIQFNNVYFKFAQTLLESLEINEPQAIKILHSVNLSNEQINYFSKYSNIKIFNSKVFRPHKRLIRYHMANRKCRVFLESLRMYPEHTHVYLDTDLLIKKPVSPLLKNINENIALVYREQAKGFHVKINSSFIMVKNEGVQLIIEWDRLMRKKYIIFTTKEKLSLLDLLKNKKNGFPKPLYIRRGRWFWDQITIHEALTNTKLPYHSLSAEQYINCNFCDNAFAWSTHDVDKELSHKNFITENEKMNFVLEKHKKL